jgi:catechol 2,3-dioxygenase-like lactoylglutathione lyase family enzyme
MGSKRASSKEAACGRTGGRGRIIGVTPSLNHTIVLCRDKAVSAAYMTEILGLAKAKAFGPFLVVEAANGVSLDFHDHWNAEAEIESQHYAFLVSEDEFSEIFGRICERGQDYWADPGLSRPSEINHNDGGRGVYFMDPDGHFLEIITRPYGSGS